MAGKTNVNNSKKSRGLIAATRITIMNNTLLSHLKQREMRGRIINKSANSKWYYPKIPDRLKIPIVCILSCIVILLL